VSSTSLEAEPVLTVDCATSLHELAEHRERINAINLASRLPDPFSTFEFYELYYAHDEFLRHGVDSELWFLTVRDAGRIIGYLPLRRVRDRALGIGCSKLEFFATHDNDRPHLVARPADEKRCREAVFQWLHERRRDWGFLELKQQPAESILCDTNAFSSSRGYYVRKFPNLENSSIAIRWRTLREWFGDLSHNMRHNIGRQFRALTALGRLEHVGSSHPAATPVLLDLYRTIETRSWKAGADATISRSPRRIEFFRDLLGPRSPLRVRIDLLLLDGTPIAGLLCGGFEKRLYALHSVFDDAYSKAGPGGSALLFGMREAIEGGYLAFNLLSGFSYYKARWRADVTRTDAVQVFRVGSPRFFRALLGGLRRALGVNGEQRGDFNLVRRESAAAPSPSPHAAGDRVRIEGLLTELARMGVASEGPEEMARSFPFAVRATPGRTHLAAAS
jgi:CelD/BcsL family acetyltransferase involved in cellulose biosynthesis